MKLKLLAVILLFAAIAFTAFAQEEGETLTLGDFSFGYDPNFAANINITRYPGDPVEQGPGFSDAPYTRFTLYDHFPTPESWFEAKAGISVYRMEDIAKYDFLQAQVDQLQTLLEAKSDLAETAQLPFVPVLPHGQILHAHAEYIETDAVRGIGYIFQSNAALEPFLSNSFSYTFQGISTDGNYYLSVGVPLTFGYFPAEPEPIDPEEFSANWEEYLANAVTVLNEAADNEFSPSLEAVKGLIQTFAFTSNE